MNLAVHRGHIKIARLLYERDVFPHYQPFVGTWFNWFCMFFCISAVFVPFLLYPLLVGTSLVFHLFHNPMLFVKFIILTPNPLSFIVLAVISSILPDIWFSFGVGSGTSPKLDY